MPDGWDTVEVVRSDPRGTWSVVERGASYRETGQRAMMWRAASGETPLPILENLWIADRLKPPFQQVLAYRDTEPPHLVVERVWGISARERLSLGAASLGQALAVGVFLCRALRDLAAMKAPDGEPLGLRGTALGLDDVWLTPAGPRLRNALRSARLLSAGPTQPTEIDQLAPEHARGAPAQEPERDVYAVAMAVLSLLRGRSPLLRTTPEDTLRALLSPERALPVDDLPDSLAATLLRALDPNPNKRPPNAAALETEWRQAADRHGIHLPSRPGVPDDAALGWLWS